ncbi:MAG: hypothetical protein GY756_05335 [bacterium]|nr:hypothetical protein [bacterium]
MKHIILEGSPYEIGFQHGTKLKYLVDAMVKSLSMDYLSSKEINELKANEIINDLRKSAPDLLDEFKGISDGAQVDFYRLIYVNTIYLHYCSVIAFCESEDGPMLGKNMDFPGYAFQMLFTVIPDNGNSFVHIGAAGSISSYGGINSKGLGMGHSIVFLKKEILKNKNGFPIAFSRRLALQYCSNTNEAVDSIISQNTKTVGDNITFIDKTGNTKLIEKSPYGYQVRSPENKNLFSTNHFIHKENQDLIDYKEESIKRYEHIEKLLDNNHPLNSNLMKMILSKNDTDNNICKKTTLLSYIVYPQKLTMQVTDGYPTIDGYNDFQVDLNDLIKESSLISGIKLKQKWN